LSAFRREDVAERRDACGVLGEVCCDRAVDPHRPYLLFVVGLPAVTVGGTDPPVSHPICFRGRVREVPVVQQCRGCCASRGCCGLTITVGERLIVTRVVGGPGLIRYRWLTGKSCSGLRVVSVICLDGAWGPRCDGAE
jgi:hypothetical protein